MVKKKSNYKYLEILDTRFGDNDIFGHMNNVIYYALFDSVINRFLISKCNYKPLTSQTIAVSPETRCIFRKSLRYPDKVLAGLSTFKIGKTRVIYDIALFSESSDLACAEGHFVHVFVDRNDMSKKHNIPEEIKVELTKL